MHILLSVLKIIGIVLLVLLIMLFVVALLVLFVPIYYKADGNYKERKACAKVQLSFLFPLLYVFLSYTDGNPEGKIKVFGICIRDFFNKKPQKSKKRRKKVKKTSKPQNTSPSIPKEDMRTAPNIEANPRVNVEKKQNQSDSKKYQLETKEPPPEEKEKSIIDKIRYYISFLKEKIFFVISIIKKWKQKGVDFREKTKDIAAKIKHYKEIWEMDVTRRAFTKAKKSLSRLFNSIKPKKGRLYIHFGTEDPAKTGEICAYFGMIYPFVGNYVMIEPDFEQIIAEGDFFVKGYITIFALLRAAWIFLFDKDIKTLKEILTNTDLEEDKNE